MDNGLAVKRSSVDMKLNDEELSDLGIGFHNEILEKMKWKKEDFKRIDDEKQFKNKFGELKLKIELFILIGQNILISDITNDASECIEYVLRNVQNYRW